MRYFVTGATGFVGGAVARQLRAAGHDVVAIVRDPAKATELGDLGVDVRSGDVTDRASMNGPMRGVDGVFHIAGWYKVGRKGRDRAYAVNVEGTRNVLELMQELEIAKGVYTSTLAVYSDTRGRVVDETFVPRGPWISVYDRTKWRAHYEVANPMMKAGLPLVVVEPGVVYGPGDTSQLGALFHRYLHGKVRAIPRDAAYCWGHIEDVCRGHLLAMEKGRIGEAYHLAGPRHTLPEAFGIAEKITGIPAPRTLVSRRALRLLAAITRSETLRAAPATYLGNPAKANRELGWTARPLEEGMRETLPREMRRLGLSALELTSSA